MQKFYWFRLRAVLYFQKVMRINTGTTLIEVFVRYSPELPQKIRTDQGHLSLKNEENLRAASLRRTLLVLIKSECG